MSGGRGLLAIVGGIAALLVVTVVVVLLASNRPPRAYPAGSPEAAVQGYLQAWGAHDLETAWTYFSTSARNGVTQEQYRRQVQDYGALNEPPNGPARRVYIDRTTVTGDRAELQLTIEETYVQGLGVTQGRQTQSLAMVREDGQWRFDTLFVGLQMGWPGLEPYGKLEPAPTAP